LDRKDAASFYEACCFHATTAAVLRQMNKSHANAKEADLEVDHALALLRQAVASGWQNAGRLKKDDALQCLRPLDGYKQVLAQLEKLDHVPATSK
jgi:hypothetical protein